MDPDFSNISIEQGTDKQIAVQVAEQLTWMIASGQIPPGTKLPNIRSFAETLNINLHTVRSAYHKLEENNLVTMRRGVGSIVREFDPFVVASRSSNLPSHTVGVLVADLGNPFYPTLISGIEDVAFDNHSLLIIAETRERHARASETLDMLITRQVDGLIITPYGLELGSDEAQEPEDYPVPVVYVDRPEVRGYSVLLDGHGAGKVAADHLIDLGHQSIAIISGLTNVPTLRQVFDGFVEQIEARGYSLPSEKVIEVDRFSFDHGYDAASELLALPEPPTGIFAAGDILAIGAMRAIQDDGHSVPDDVAMIGYNDIESAAYCEPRLTSIRTPTRELGAESMQLLQRLIQGEEISERRLILPTELVIRESCGASL